MRTRPVSGDESSDELARVIRSSSVPFMPPLFTSVPTLEDAASYISETTSYFTQCFSGFAEPENDIDGQDLMTSGGGSLLNDEHTSTGNSSLHLGGSPRAYSSSSISGSVSSTNSSLIGSNAGEISGNASNGTSLFQSLISRVRKTVRGSADDIGWLRRAPGAQPVEEATDRFSAILDNVRKGEHKLPNSVVYLLIPGLFSNHGPLYFVNTKLSFSKMGLACHIAKIHSEASVEKNAKEIKEYIEEIYWGSKKRVLLLGHSKGGVDAAAALAKYWPELEDKVAGLALAQSPYGGSPIASDILREGQLGDYVQLRQVMEVVVRRLLKGDVQALEDLTYEKRKEFLGKYQLPKELPVVSFHTEAKISPAVLATLSHVAHAEFPTIGAGQAAKLPIIMPLAAAMAACAQLLVIRYGEKSDGLVTRCDAEVPGSVVVRPERKMDHAWMVYSSLSDDPGEASAAEVCEALLTLLVEVGQKRRHDDSMKDD